jgi:hypothetical protein
VEGRGRVLTELVLASQCLCPVRLVSDLYGPSDTQHIPEQNDNPTRPSNYVLQVNVIQYRATIVGYNAWNVYCTFHTLCEDELWSFWLLDYQLP